MQVLGVDRSGADGQRLQDRVEGTLARSQTNVGQEAQRSYTGNVTFKLFLYCSELF